MKMNLHLEHIKREKELYDTRHWVVTYTVPVTFIDNDGIPHAENLYLQYDLSPEGSDGIDLMTDTQVEQAFWGYKPPRMSAKWVERLITEEQDAIMSILNESIKGE